MLQLLLQAQPEFPTSNRLLYSTWYTELSKISDDEFGECTWYTELSKISDDEFGECLDSRDPPQVDISLYTNSIGYTTYHMAEARQSYQQVLVQY